MTALKWTCDAQGNWRQVLMAVRQVDGRLIEVGKVDLGGPTAVWRTAA